MYGLPSAPSGYSWHYSRLVLSEVLFSWNKEGSSLSTPLSNALKGQKLTPRPTKRNWGSSWDQIVYWRTGKNLFTFILVGQYLARRPITFKSLETLRSTSLPLECRLTDEKLPLHVLLPPSSVQSIRRVTPLAGRSVTERVFYPCINHGGTQIYWWYCSRQFVIRPHTIGTNVNLEGWIITVILITDSVYFTVWRTYLILRHSFGFISRRVDGVNSFVSVLRILRIDLNDQNLRVYLVESF